ncbi:MAG: cob(I)yrinic acid a,c-diamide adenosyltransferase [Desulfarculaceae bacterium]|nr:cob(I)yrinic acid a,c-diamide adenosyltransferase [Desulfarculaceae bacterium]
MNQRTTMQHIYYPDERHGLVQRPGLGLVHICYGQGVGKSTRSVGLAIRAASAGLRVFFVQFMKSGDSSEVKILANTENIIYRCPGKHPFILSKGPQAEHYEHAEEALWYAQRAAKEGAEVIICDELLSALVFKVLSVERALNLILRCRGSVELVLTGIDASPVIQEAADYVTEFRQVKHPYYKGHMARKGIEF